MVNASTCAVQKQELQWRHGFKRHAVLPENSSGMDHALKSQPNNPDVDHRPMLQPIPPPVQVEFAQEDT